MKEREEMKQMSIDDVQESELMAKLQKDAEGYINEVLPPKSLFLAKNGTKSRNARALVWAVKTGSVMNLRAVLNAITKNAFRFEMDVSKMEELEGQRLTNIRRGLLGSHIGKIVQHSTSKEFGLIHGINHSGHNRERGTRESLDKYLKGNLHVQLILLDEENGVRNTTWSLESFKDLEVDPVSFFVFRYGVEKP